MKDKVVILKMINGAEVIAKTSGDFVYKKCRVFQIMNDGKGGAQAGLIPFIMVAPDADCFIEKSNIVTEVDCPSDIEKSYLQEVSTIALV